MVGNPVFQNRSNKWPVLRIFQVVYFALLLVFSFLLLKSLPIGFQQAREFEYAWVAQSFADGHGFSFIGKDHWLFPESEPEEYELTNFQEPVYPLLLGSFLRIFGPAGIRVMLTLQAMFLILTSLVLYQLGSTVFSPWVGMLASLLLMASSNVRLNSITDLSNAVLAGLLISLSFYAIFWFERRMTLGRGLILGGLFGIAALTHSTAAALPMLAALYFLAPKVEGSARPWKPVLVFLTACGVVLSPWIIRNGLVFGKFTPFRTGLGYNSYISGPLLAETFDPGYRACPGGEPAFKSTSPSDAVAIVNQQSPRLALYLRGYECFMQKAPAGWRGLNELQRDDVYLKEVLKFLREYPVTALAIACYKALFFLSLGGLVRGFLTAVAFLGVLLSLRTRHGLLISAFFLLYHATYVVGFSFFYRFRYPIEPVMMLFSATALVAVISRLVQLPAGRVGLKKA